MEESRTSQFSLCGNFFAHATRNGALKIWDTRTSKLHQEYTPSSHLASLGSCLQWAPFKMRHGGVEGGGGKKKKKPRMEKAETAAVETLHLVAWGSEPGDVFLYSFAKGELHNRFTGGHVNARINDLCWSSDGTKLFSCAEDRRIAEWDVVAGKLTGSWKADKQPVASLSISADGAFLISASRKIKFWDAKTHQLLQTFAGGVGVLLVFVSFYAVLLYKCLTSPLSPSLFKLNITTANNPERWQYSQTPREDALQ